MEGSTLAPELFRLFLNECLLKHNESINVTVRYFIYRPQIFTICVPQLSEVDVLLDGSYQVGIMLSPLLTL